MYFNTKGNQSWIFIGKTDAEAEAPILCWLIGKDSDAGKDWSQEEEGMTEDEMVGWYHWFNGHEFEKALGDSRGQRSAGSQYEETPPWQRSWGRKPDKRKGMIQLQGFPLGFPEHLPTKTRVGLILLYCAFHSSDILWKKVNSGLQSPAYERNVSAQTPLMAL